MSPATYLAQLPSLIAEIDAGRIDIGTRTAPLADVEAVWTAAEVPGLRTVLVP